jgi:hypothetical protein
VGDLPPGWVVKGLKKGAAKGGGLRRQWFENTITGEIRMKRPKH